jgi:2-keto-3-deoxy-L-fuconate dehydrogenase
VRLKGKTALVTAAAAGIGRAVAEAFHAEGATVHAVDLDGAGLATLEGVNAHAIDLLDLAALEQLAAATGPVDILFNGAGMVAVGSVLECSEEDWERSFALNATTMFRLIKLYLPGMIAAGGGSIVNVASVASSLIGVPNRFAYGASKAAIIGLTKAVAADFVAQGIRCNAICPGTVESPSCSPACAPMPRRPASASRKATPSSAPASRWGVWGRSRKSPRWRCISLRTRAALPQAQQPSSTADGR